MNINDKNAQDLIFGYTWEEIKEAQRGKPLIRKPAPRETGDEKDICLPSDVDLLIKHGLKELENMGYHGVLDRLARAGIKEVIK